MIEEPSGRMDGQIPGFFHSEIMRRVGKNSVIGADGRFRNVRNDEIDRFITVEDPGGAGACAVEDDLAAADGLLPFGTGTVGEPGGEPAVKAAVFAFGAGRAADDAFFLRDHKSEQRWHSQWDSNPCYQDENLVS